jgi:serine/threonine-protein kinase ATR
VEVADLRKELCTNPLGAFPNPQVFGEATAVLKTFRALNLGDEDDRPTKRRKTLPDSSEDINELTYKQLVIVLNGSSQESPVLNLSNLHNIIQ